MGVLILIFGLADNALFELEWGDLKINTSQTGLVVSILGAAICFFTTKNLPQGVMVLGDKPTKKEKFFSNLPKISVIVFVVALIILIITIL